jgi:hypothetical protein
MHVSSCTDPNIPANDIWSMPSEIRRPLVSALVNCSRTNTIAELLCRLAWLGPTEHELQHTCLL